MHVGSSEPQEVWGELMRSRGLQQTPGGVEEDGEVQGGVRSPQEVWGELMRCRGAAANPRRCVCMHAITPCEACMPKP